MLLKAFSGFAGLPKHDTSPRYTRAERLMLRPEYAEIHSFGFDGTGHSA